MNRCISVAAVALTAGFANAQVTQFFATIDGDQEVPPSGSPATGTLTGSYDAGANVFSFSWSVMDLMGTPSSPGAHIHSAPFGENGPVVFGFSNPDGTWGLTGSAVWTDLSSTHVDALFSENLYVNFHTDMFPAGELRGQIMVVPTPGVLGLAGLACIGAARRRRDRSPASA